MHLQLSSMNFQQGHPSSIWAFLVPKLHARDFLLPFFPTGLALDLNRRLHGQHLVKLVVVKAIQGFLETSEPEKSLALSFHGWSGTGKNFVARIIAEHLYQDGLKSDCVKVYISLFHFPHSGYVDIYKVREEL